MIFKTFQSDLDGISNKIGFSKRSFAEWGKQVATSFKESEGRINGFKNALKTALVAPVEKYDGWIKNSLGEIVSKKNIDTHIPQLTSEKASDLAQRIREQSIALVGATNGWEDYFSELEKNKQGYIVDLIKNTDDLSKLTGEDLVKACQKAREAVIAHNENIKNMSFSSKAGKVALQALATAGNMFLSWGISKLIEAAVKGIDELANSSRNCKKRVDDLMSSYKAALDKANSSKDTIEGLAAKYEELSDGVGRLGENVSLTADEYAEYNGIVNQIAEMFPTLIQGYTSEGNAILSLKGNVEQLRDAYREAQQEAYNLLIATGKDSGGNDILEQWNDINDTGYWARFLDFGSNDVGKGVSVSEAIAQLKAINDMPVERYREILRIVGSGYEDKINGLSDIEKSVGYSTYLSKALGLNSGISDEDFAAAKKQAKVLVQTHNAEIESALSDVKTLANAYLMTNADFKQLDAQSQSAASMIVNSMNADIADGFSTKDKVGQYVDDIVQLIGNNTDVRDALQELFTLDTSGMSVREASERVNSYINTIAAKLDDEDSDSLKIRLGFDDSNTDTLVNNVKKKLKDKFRGNVEDLTFEDLKIAAEQIEANKVRLLSWDELISKIEKYKASIKEASSTSLLSIPDTITRLNDKLKPAMDSLASAWNGIFTDDGFKLKEADVLSITASIKKELDEMGKQGLQVDASSFEDFVRVLTDTSSTADMVKEQFNSLTMLIAQAGLSGAEDFKTLKSALDDFGVVNSELVAFDALISNTGALKAAGLDLANVTDKQIIDAFAREYVSAENASQAIEMLKFQKELCKSQDMNTAEEVDNLLTLAKNAGYTGEVIERLTELERIYQEVASGTLNPYQLDKKLARASELEAAIKESSNKIKYETNVDFTGIGKSGGGSSDAYKKQYEKELRELKRFHDLGIISDEQYWKARIDLNEKYYGKSSGMHQKYLEEYQDNEKEILEGIKSLWRDYYADRKNGLSDLISYAEKLYDKQIDALNEQIDLLEERRDAEEEYWRSRIDAIEEEISALEDANSERERAINLQERQYQLQRAMQQRTVLLFTEEKGMVWVNDTKAERDARNELTDAEHNVKVSDLQKQQKELEKQLDSILKSYDSQIEAIEKQIDGLRKVKSAWSEIASNQELKELEERLKTIFGDDVKDKILSGNTEFINGIVSQYSSTSEMLRTIEDATLADIQNMVAQYGILPENLMPIMGMTAEIKESLGSIDTSGFNSNLDGVAQSSADAAEKVQGVTDALNELSNDVSNYRLPPINADDFMASFADDGEIMKSLRGFTHRFQSICAEIPGIWNQSLSDAFGTGGNNPLDGGAAAAGHSKYDALFSPLLSAVNNCKSVMQDKLKECLGAFTDFQEDLSGVIGVGGSGGQEQPGGDGKKEGSASGGEKKSEGESGAGTIVGAIQEGGALIEQYLNGEEESWSASFVTAADSIHNTATYIVECIESMAEAIVSACASAIEAINMLELAQGGAGNHPTPSFTRMGHGHGAIGDAFANGTGAKGTEKDEKNAVVSEYGQREMVVFPNGKTVITDEPTAMDMPKGTVVYNEKQTDAILKNKITQTGSAHAAGTDEGWFIGPGGHRYRPIQPGDRAWELQKAFEPLLKKLDENPGYLAANAMIEHNRQMEKVVNQLNHANVVTNTRNVQPVVNIGDINISCPGVTSKEVMNEVGIALQREIGNLGLRALQEPIRRY